MSARGEEVFGLKSIRLRQGKLDNTQKDEVFGVLILSEQTVIFIGNLWSEKSCQSSFQQNIFITVARDPSLEDQTYGGHAGAD